ncbi:conserved hypothetical protein [Vibrio nigripulchritudo MADA3029]|uniref:sce7726 family protein n=1 Tax=Vibrio nigripulchritudo TaxID=28173 RepID=UPI0003B208C9|nr:sce7726 family protein [Vibrio nigripulchritudo]KJY79936.1 hypothetical protein TW74_06155 [Vibrio nigripulchritudo]CCN50202.1 conserved hypothetical protein [Vibrio nigripulchritudo MADA3020]CCN53242.1 conserved hypothetical protein [Vibrio nigripulchritudo MADA3021]CCN59234.1 conserved hypothetical protein [Vibrio nigripulchritudo MADA3029]
MSNFQDKDRLLESELKALTLNYMLEKGFLSVDDVISNEFLLKSSARRADIVISRNDELWAVEVKSEADSLTRLDGQVSAYLDCFDKVIVVSASKHVSHVLQMVPKEVAVWEVRGSRIVVVQRGRKRIQNCTKSLTSMLKLPKLRSLLKKYDFNLESRKRKHLEQLVTQHISLKCLRKAVLDEFNSKYSLTSKVFFESLNGQRVRSEDLEELSVYKNPNIVILDHEEELTKMLAVFDNLALSSQGKHNYQEATCETP